MKNHALITGSSKGLGKALAIECAKRNFNVILVALPGTGINQMGDFIESNYDVKAYCYEIDLSAKKGCIQLYNKLKEQGICINVLINNAGLLSTGLFEEIDSDHYERLININILAPTILTRLFLEDLQKSSSSFILNVGSLSGYFYLPAKQVYGATKAFIYSFSCSLQKELSKKVSVSVLCPGGINSGELSILNNKAGSWVSRSSIMDPAEVASIAIRQMFKGKRVIIPGRLNAIFLFLNSCLPLHLKNKIIASHMKKLWLQNKQTLQLLANSNC